MGTSGDGVVVIWQIKAVGNGALNLHARVLTVIIQVTNYIVGVVTITMGLGVHA
jgi:hypothetical protein